jgi:hypothetical protein
VVKDDKIYTKDLAIAIKKDQSVEFGHDYVTELDFIKAVKKRFESDWLQHHINPK